MNLNINIHRINKQPAILVSLHIPQLEDALKKQTLQRHPLLAMIPLILTLSTLLGQWNPILLDG